MKIYTKTGDKGQTSLYGGKRITKSAMRVEAYGTVDELNSIIGIAMSYMRDTAIQTALIGIQNDLFAIGSSLANPSVQQQSKLIRKVDDFEVMIDTMTKKLPQLRHFILPGGSNSGSYLHYSRTVCRRAERRIVELANSEHLDGDILVYMNRLSDLLFTMARYENHLAKNKEVIWKKS